MKDFLTALSLLTVVPVPLIPVKEGETWQGGRALAFYPAVGLAIGLLLVASRILLQVAFPALVVAVLIVVLWAIITGGLHLDGFTDACDALFVPATRERRLDILRDVHVGAFGAAGLVLLLLTKVSATATITSFWPIVLAPVLGRWAIVYAATFPLARKEGMAALFRSGFTSRELAIASVIALVVSISAGLFGVVAFVLALVAAALVAWLTMARIGGMTGDIYGTVCETVEVTVLLVGTLALPVLHLLPT